MTAPLDLYHWPTATGFKISIALEEVKLPASEDFEPEIRFQLADLVTDGPLPVQLSRGCRKAQMPGDQVEQFEGIISS